MAISTISIPIEDNIAQLYKTAPEGKRKRLQMLIGFLVQEFAESTPKSLLSVMDEMSREAASNGLTPEILESILNENE